MCIQDPPIHMEYHYGKGMTFDHDVMRAYTQSGKYVDFVVWPTLYLHKDGALLAKSVVQATGDQHGHTYDPNRRQAGTNLGEVHLESGYTRNNQQRYQKGNQNFNRAVHDRSIKSAKDVLQYSQPEISNVETDFYNDTYQGRGFSTTDAAYHGTYLNPQRNELGGNTGFTYTNYGKEPQMDRRGNRYDQSSHVNYRQVQGGYMTAGNIRGIEGGAGGYSGSGGRHRDDGVGDAAFYRGDAPEALSKQNRNEYKHDTWRYNQHVTNDQKSKNIWRKSTKLSNAKWIG